AVPGCALAGVRDEQAVEAARFGQRVERRIAGPVEKRAIGVNQVVEAIDQNADRQAVEDRPAFLRVAAAVAVARRLGWGRLLRAGREVVARAGVRAGVLEAVAQFARKLVEIG